jgi:DNA repair protein RadC
MLLDNSTQLIKTVRINEGGISGTLVDLKKVYKIALDNYTSSLILAHNHPSANLQPSYQDKKLTKKIINAGKLLDINVLDHLIIGWDNYFSFADEGMI